MFRNINIFVSFLKGFFVAIFILLFSFISVEAKEVRPISPKLWKNFSDQDFEYLHKISKALDNKNYDEAFHYAKSLSDKKGEIVITQDPTAAPTAVIEKTSLVDAVNNIILWKKYSEGNFAQDGSSKEVVFNDVSRFVNDNPFYSNIADLRRMAERLAAVNHVPYRLSEQYFKSNPALTLDSKLYLIKTKAEFLLTFKGSEAQKQKIADEIQELIITTWIKEDFSLTSEQDYLAKYGKQLAEPDHVKRIHRLLWDNKIDDAKRILTMVNEDQQKLFLAIIEIKTMPKYIDNIVLSVPRNLRLNDNLAYNRILWYKSKDRLDDLIDLIQKIDKVEYPEKWWSVRRFFAREMIKRKEYKIAYNIVSRHGLPAQNSDFWEAEWMSGWIALRFLDEAKQAYQHFDILYKNVSQPVTISRAAYWLGMSADRLGDKSKAIDWYKISAKYPVFFYGQLGIHKHRQLDSINANSDIILPKDPDITVGDIKKISASMPTKIAYVLALMGDKSSSTKVFEYAVNNSSSDGQIAVIMRIVNELKDRQIDARISRVAARKNVFFIKDKFQIVSEVSSDEYAPLVHAIIKQESGFAPTALSSVGAIGFMQLMPETAKLVAKDLGIAYNRKKLATDISYNVKLGSHYIKQLIDRFDGSEMLAIASYNAGPNATQRWITEFYDPRKEKDIDKVVDWIELITYAETRNYVQRIMENLIVYKYLMSRSNYDAIK